MKTMIFILTKDTIVNTGSIGYLAGAIIALLICGYLFYALIKPDKF
jgi:K+-transporting ATPase KdpF subunit